MSSEGSGRRNGQRHQEQGTLAQGLRRLARTSHEAIDRLGKRLQRVPIARTVISLLSGITPLGWGLGAIGLAGIAVGLAARWNEMAIVAVAALTLLFGALILSLIPLSCSVALHLAAQRITVGQDAYGEILVTNPTGRTLRPVRLELNVDSAVVPVWTSPIEAHGEHRDSFVIETSRRGRRRVGPVRVARGDAFGLVRRVRATSDILDLRVHPRTVTVPFSAIGLVRDLEGITTQDLSSADVSFRALRDYVPGDDRRNVHWRTTARTGKMMVREFEETRRAHLLLILDNDQLAWGIDEEFEDGISTIASLARCAYTDSIAVSTLTRDQPLNSASSVSLLDALTEVSAISVSHSLAEDVHWAGAETPSASVAIVVTGSGRSIEHIRYSLTTIDPSVRALAIRIDSSDKASVRMVGGFTLVTISSLGELPSVMRQVSA
ncbi:MAG: DUF58 domain-containing protein [Actinomycetaceae bacterium]|nr:DUF58 domain-containing protein [Actinomycetaceae bacterium]